MNRLKLLSAVAGLLLLAGCSSTVFINPNILPENPGNGGKFHERVAVSFTDGLASLVLRVKSTKPIMSLDVPCTYTFEMGPPLTAALRRSVSAAYDSAVVVTEPVVPGQFHRVLRFSLEDTSIEAVVDYRGGGSPSARANCMVLIKMEVRDGKTFDLLKEIKLTGYGSGSELAVLFSPNETFAQAAEEAIKELADVVASLLANGFAEMKDYGTGSGIRFRYRMQQTGTRLRDK